MPFFTFIQDEKEEKFYGDYHFDDEDEKVAKIVIVEAEDYLQAKNKISRVGFRREPTCRCFGCYDYVLWTSENGENNEGTEKPMFRGKFAIPVQEVPYKPVDSFSRAFIMNSDGTKVWAEIR